MRNGRSLEGHCSKNMLLWMSAISAWIYSPLLFFSDSIPVLCVPCETHAFWTPIQVHRSPVVSWWQAFKLITEGEWLSLERIGSCKKSHKESSVCLWTRGMRILGKWFGRVEVRFHREIFLREQTPVWKLSKVESLPSGHSRLTVIINIHQMDASPLWAYVSGLICALFKPENNFVCSIFYPCEKYHKAYSV